MGTDKSIATVIDKTSKIGNYSHVGSNNENGQICLFDKEQTRIPTTTTTTSKTTCSNHDEAENNKIDWCQSCIIDLYPHFLFWLAFLYAKLAMPTIVRFIVTKTKVVSAIMLWVPLYQTIRLLSLKKESIIQQQQGTE